jgi:hypothetical protein
MKLVRSDSPEVIDSIASAGALARWGWYGLTLVCIASVPGLLIVLFATLIVSVPAAVWLGVPIILTLNGYFFWRGSPHLSWVIAGCADRVFVRLFVQRKKRKWNIEEPDVIMFEASEIALKARIVDVFLYGPKPRRVERLVIELSPAIVQSFSSHIQSSLNPNNLSKQVYVTNEEGCLTMEWKWCRPALPVFLQEVGRECPSVATGEERCELDLNGIWHGFREKPNAEQRRMLFQAMRLGFGSKCAQLLSLYRFMPLQEAGAYLAEIEREETGAENIARCSVCRF